MGETRKPALGSWCVFEGDRPAGHLVHFDPIEWPLTFRVHRTRDGIAELVDIEVSEDFVVKVLTAGAVDVRGDLETPTPVTVVTVAPPKPS